MAREIKTVFALDGETKYKDAVKSINKEQRLLNVEMKASLEAFDDTTDATKKLETQAENLAKQIELQKKKVAEAENAVKQAAKAYGEADDRTMEYRIQLSRAETNLLRMGKSLDKTNKELRVSKSRLNDAGESVEKAGKKMQDFGGKTEKAGEKLSKLTKPAAAVGTAFLALGAKTVISAKNMNQALNQFIGATGKSVDEAERYKKVLTDIYQDNFGESFGDIADVMTRINQQMGDMPDEKLKKTAENAILMRDTFDMDVNESIRGVNALMKQFGLDSETAFNLMTQGAQKGLNQNQDLADQISEYSVYYADLGYSVEDMFNALANGAKDGTYQIDYLNDAIKEFGIKSKDGSTASQEAFQALGLDADAMTKKFAAGGETANAAFGQVTKALFNMDDKVQQNQIGVALFGTKWEDLGIDAIRALTNTNGAIDATKDKLGELNEIKYDDIGSMLQALGREIEVELLPAAQDIMPILEETVKEMMPGIKKALPQVTNLVKDAVPVIGDVAEAVLGVVEGFQDLSPETQSFIIKMGLAVAALGPFVRTFGKVSSAVGNVTSGIGKYLEKLAEKKAAEAAASVATEGVASSAGGLLGMLGKLASPTGIAIAAITVFTGLAAAFLSGKSEAEQLRDEIRSMGEDFVPMTERVAEAKGILGEYQFDVTATGQAVESVRTKIEETEKKISAAYAAYHAANKETRGSELTEIKQFNADLLKLNLEELSMYTLAQEAIYANLVQGYTKVSTETAPDLIKSVTEAVEQAEKAAKDVLTRGEKAALLNNLIPGTDEFKAAMEPYVDASNKLLEDTRTNVNEIMTLSMQQLEESDKSSAQKLENVAGYNQQIIEEEKRWQQQQNEIRSRGVKEGTETWNSYEEAHLRNLADITSAAGTTFAGINDEWLNSWISLVDTQAKEGGKLPAESKEILNSLLGVFSSMPDDLNDLGELSMVRLGRAIAASRPDVTNAAELTDEECIKIFRDSVDEYSKAGTSNTEAYADSTRKNRPKAERASRDVATAANKPLKNGVKDAERAGKDTGTSFATALRKKKSSANQASQEVKNATTSPLSTLASIFKQRGESGVGSLSSGIRAKKQNVKTAAGEAKVEADRGLSGLIGDRGSAFSAGKSAISYLVRGISQQFGSLFQIAVRAANQFISGLLSPKGFHRGSPYKKMTAIAKDAVESFTGQVEVEGPKAESAGADMAKATVKGVKSESARLAEAQRFLEQQLTGTKLADQLAYATSGRMPGTGSSFIEVPVSKVTKTGADNSTHITVNLNGATIRSDNDIKKLAQQLAVEAERRKRARGA